VITIILQPIGAVDRGTVGFLEEELRLIFGASEVMPTAEVPKAAHVPERKQLEGTAVLQSLPAPDPGDGDALLGVIDEDLFVADTYFITPLQILPKRDRS